jgi:hypothetical protein
VPPIAEFVGALEQRLEMVVVEHGTSSEEQFLRRRQAAEYLRSKYGFGAMATLAKGAVTGDTPYIRRAGKMVLYTKASLDEWALKKIGPPQRSTSDKPEHSSSGEVEIVV